MHKSNVALEEGYIWSKWR